MVHDALDVGYRLFELTLFQHNRREISSAIKKYLPWFGLSRSDIFVSVKLNILRPHTAKVLLGSTIQTPSPKSVADWMEQCVQRCLDEFEGYIDLCLLHYPKDIRIANDDSNNCADRQEAYEVLAKYRAENCSVRSIGVANFEPKHIEQLVAAGLPYPAANQCEMHLFLQRNDLLRYCESKNIVLQAHSIFAYRKQTFSSEIYQCMDRIASELGLNKSQLNVIFLLGRSSTHIDIVPMVWPCLLGNSEQIWAQRRSALKQVIACGDKAMSDKAASVMRDNVILSTFDREKEGDGYFTQCRQWDVK